MRLQRASSKAIKYACAKFHYSHKHPIYSLAYSVFNNENQWCGVVLFSRGATPAIGSPYNLKQGQILELQRVALNGKQESTSKAVSIAITLLRKDAPLCELIVSYADGNQNHLGVMYQASNWYYVGAKKSCDEFTDKRTGRNIHSRMVNRKGVFNSTDLAIGKRWTYEEVNRVKKPFPKYKYLYPLTKETKLLCSKLSKPYPKRGNSLTAEHPVNQSEGGVQFDLAAQNTVE